MIRRAVGRAIRRSAGRSGADAAKEVLAGRLVALGKSHDLLLGGLQAQDLGSLG